MAGFALVAHESRRHAIEEWDPVQLSEKRSQLDIGWRESDQAHAQSALEGETVRVFQGGPREVAELYGGFLALQAHLQQGQPWRHGAGERGKQPRRFDRRA